VATEKLKKTAESLWNQGYNIVLLKDKKPLHDWRKLINERQTEQEFHSLPWQEANQFAAVCGTKLDNGLYLACVDFDVKNLENDVIEKGKEVLNYLPVTQTEETPTKGKHLVYYCHVKPATVSAYHNICALEILGEAKLCIMAPSQGYRKFNDNLPSEVQDFEDLLLKALYNAGIQGQPKKDSSWFDREDLANKMYKGQNPPCINKLAKGTSEGLRNEYGIRLASYYLNFRGYQPQTVQKMMKEWNRLNNPALDALELDSTIRSAAQGNYVYGCHDSILEKACNREECPIAPKTVVLTEEQKKNAEKILERDDLLKIVLIYGRKRLIGEDNILLINFVEIASGQTRYSISGIISGFSGSGKNESIRAVKPLIPEEWVFEFTTSTPEAVKYIPEEFHGTLIIYEASGMQSKTGTLGLRAVGEGESIQTIYPMRDEATGKMSLGRSKTNAKNFITTESQIDIEPDLYRRVLKQSMNPSYILTKRVCAKEARDSYIPESLRDLLQPNKDCTVSLEAFQNALRAQDWKAEVIVFVPEELLSLIDVAVTMEQQVALRTQFNKILSFIKVLALLNQKRRVRFRVGDKKYVIAAPEDYRTGLDILSAAILETVSRIERRQRDVLDLFESKGAVLDKNKVVSELKISAVTAARALKTLARSGYLKENANCKPYTYEKIANKPNSLVILQNTSGYDSFYQKELETYLEHTLSPVTSDTIGARPNVEIIGLPALAQNGKLAEIHQPDTTSHNDKISARVAVKPFPSLTDETKQKQLVFSEKISESSLKEHEKKEPLFSSCYFCQKPIYKDDWKTDEFTAHKPAHKECYEYQQSLLRKSEAEL